MKQLLLAGAAAFMVSPALAETQTSSYYTAGVTAVITSEVSFEWEYLNGSSFTPSALAGVDSTIITSLGDASSTEVFDNIVNDNDYANGFYSATIDGSVKYFYKERIMIGAGSYHNSGFSVVRVDTLINPSYGCNVNPDTAYINQRIYWMDRTGLGLGSTVADINDVIDDNRTGTTATFSHTKACWAEGLLRPSGYVETIYDVINTALNSEVSSSISTNEDLAVAYLNAEGAVSIPETFTHWSLVPAGYDWTEFHTIWAEANSTASGREALRSWVSQWNAVSQRRHSWWDFEAGVLEYIYEGNHSGSYPGYE